ncbi:molybdate ABC transporter permease subunit [Rhizosaccharibacter radicis]|uniref:Molybdenum transport system permease n=1 Tax=Rhizosaccharibacter radicis TaxID=2782605 RepID=A0ABT1VUG2_9PROT|nr:molybdate ABC transporter permease subunit [Acetobacteraceae bacterium KSS12]
MELLRIGPDGWMAVRLTLRVSCLAVAGAAPVALALAMLLSRRRFPGRVLLDTLVHLPMVLPPVVTGWLLLLVFGLHGPVGALLWRWLRVRLAFSTAGASLACAVMVLPLMVRTIRLSLEAVDWRLRQAAQGLGAGPADRFLHVVLPLAAPGVLAALVAGFSASLGEFGAVITFAASIPGRTQTLPLAIYAALQVPDGEQQAARLASVSLVLAVAGLLGAEMVHRRIRRWLRGDG